jgi:hypothetical protein
MGRIWPWEGEEVVLVRRGVVRGGGRAMGGGEGSGMLVVVRWFANRWYGVSLIM